MLIDILLRLILQGELGCPDRMDFSCVKNLQGRVFLLNKQASTSNPRAISLDL